MPRPVNIKLIMNVYKKLGNGKCHKTVAKELKVSEAHVGRIVKFLVAEYFLVPQSLKSQIRLYNKTIRVPTLKIISDVLNFKRDEGGSYRSGIHRNQYSSELKSEVSQTVIDWCRLIVPKGTRKYLFPPNKKLKLGFNIIIHDGKNKRSVVFSLYRMHLTVAELPLSDKIIKERVERIAYNVQHFFKIKLGRPKPLGKSKEYAVVPKEKFLLDALEDTIFEIDSPVGKIKADKSGDPDVLDGKEIEFDNVALTTTYLELIPAVHMMGYLAVDNKDKLEHLEVEFAEFKDMMGEIRPMLVTIIKYIDNEKKSKKFSEELKKHREKENKERGVI